MPTRGRPPALGGAWRAPYAASAVSKSRSTPTPHGCASFLHCPTTGCATHVPAAAADDDSRVGTSHHPIKSIPRSPAPPRDRSMHRYRAASATTLASYAAPTAVVLGRRTVLALAPLLALVLVLLPDQRHHGAAATHTLLHPATVICAHPTPTPPRERQHAAHTRCTVAAITAPLLAAAIHSYVV